MDRLPPSLRNARLALAPQSNAGSPFRALFEEPLELLLAIAACLLALACGNTAPLLLARSAARQKEIAIRRSVGAAGFNHDRLPLVWTRHGQAALGRGPALMDLYRTAQTGLGSIPGALGKRFAFRGVKEHWTIVGVMRDTKLDAWRDEPWPEF